MSQPYKHSILVLGGARSGKSAYAEDLALTLSEKPIYLATGRAWDDEMVARISKHKDRRSHQWISIEEPIEVFRTLKDHSDTNTTLLLDCLTLWVTKLMLEERDVEQEFQVFEAAVRAFKGNLILVSNEVGMGIVPENKMAREFRDYVGDLHKRIADIANEVYLVVAGIPVTVKNINTSSL